MVLVVRLGVNNIGMYLTKLHITLRNLSITLIIYFWSEHFVSTGADVAGIASS